MTSQQVNNLCTYLKILLAKHQEQQTLESYYTVCDQLEKIEKLSEELIIEYVEVE